MISRRKIKFNLFATLVISTLSCQINTRNWDRTLFADNKLWQVDEPKKNQHGAFTYYRFTEDGKWTVYIKNTGEKLHRKEMDDIVLIESWKLTGDSVINIGGCNYIIGTLNDTTFYYHDPNGNYGIKLHFKGDRLND